jgi:DNA-directed RNA polymerase subunit omega
MSNWHCPRFKVGGYSHGLLGRATMLILLSYRIMLPKRVQFDSTYVTLKAEELIDAASNRYRITVQVASRAKKRHRYETENTDDPMVKPVMRAILEMADELTQPEILGD